MNKTKYPKDGHYLIYVTKFDLIARDNRILVVYEYTGDPFHAMGEIQFRSIEQIYRITFSEDTPIKREYWGNEGIEIKHWTNKY